ncbi:MAG TPA: hypothetical protein VFK06_10460 [Candidatus Angelobacter sp.]|nr:hypothetical protein [Candidatus Angelobacter sp.]
MKFKFLTLLVLAALSLSGLAQAQSQTHPESNSPLSLVKTAGTVAVNTQHADLEHFLAIYVDPSNWKSGLGDKDLGPFLKLKEGKPGRSAVLFFTQNMDYAICVYFDGEAAFGVTAAKAGSGGTIEASSISAGYKAVSKEMLQPAGKNYDFSEMEINMDNGDPISAWQIKPTGK